MPLDLRRWLGLTPHPDGQAAAVEADALQSGEVLAADVAPLRRTVPQPGTVIQAALAQKVLHGWMQNLHQTRYPLTLNLRNNTADEAALLMGVVREALRAADPGDAAIRRAQEWIAQKGGDLQAAACPEAAGLVDRLHEARLAPQAYAACVGALGRRTPTARRYLDFLAARLGLPDDVARSLNRRFAA